MHSKENSNIGQECQSRSKSSPKQLIIRVDDSIKKPPMFFTDVATNYLQIKGTYRNVVVTAATGTNININVGVTHTWLPIDNGSTMSIGYGTQGEKIIYNEFKIEDNQ